MRIKTFSFVLKIISVIVFLFPLLVSAQKDEKNTQRSSSEELNFECASCKVKYSSINNSEPIRPGNAVFPLGSTVRLPTGGKVALANTYSDIDQFKYKGNSCPNTIPVDQIMLTQHLGHKSRFEITTGKSNASFNLTNATIDEISTEQFKTKIPIQGNPNFFLLQSNNAILYTSSNWTTGDIEVEVDILDHSTLPGENDLPAGVDKAVGSCYDHHVLNHHTWTFLLDNNTPPMLQQHTSNPTEGAWTTTNANQGFAVPFQYRGVAACGNTSINYSEHIVNEIFTGVNGGDILFGVEDLQENWKMQHNVETPQDAIQVIFSLPFNGDPKSFLLMNSTFTDTHAGFNSEIDSPILLADVFTDDAINNNRAGYFINQEYRTADGILLGRATVTRVLRSNSSGDIEVLIKKEHVDICQ